MAPGRSPSPSVATRNSLSPQSLHPVNLPVNMRSVTYPQSQNYQQDDFHKTVARTLSQGSTPMSMDFHPLQQTLLLDNGHFSPSEKNLLEDLRGL
ncbi:protein TPR3-like [Zea mays]|uniref:protein TPR3-like n=1 Tax=Zea mays TaxID=4577 RepID=UPI0009A9649D|nr:protein TPR3-like [Zea mays]|eukprot:XP_020393282.1 protein TPR3-like [Zea mays]